MTETRVERAAAPPWRFIAGPRLARSEQINGWAFVMPALVLLGIFLIYPIIWSLWMSFQVGKGMNFSFGGWANIVRLTKDPVYIRALTNTCIFFVVQVPIMITLALLFAVALNDPRLRFRGVFRTAIFLPCVTSLIAYSTLFKSMFAYDGVINKTLIFLHVTATPIPWLQDPFWAKILIILAITWRWTGYNMVIYLAGLQGIPNDLYEAAEVDGAGWSTKLLRITLPLLRPVILFTTILSTIGTLQIFDESYILTNGGPQNATVTVGFYLYRVAFRQGDLTYASTIGYGLLVIIVVLSVLQFRFSGEGKGER